MRGHRIMDKSGYFGERVASGEIRAFLRGIEYPSESGPSKSI